MSFLEVRNLTKSFGGVRAVDDFSFGAEQGEIVGIIGPNGAGKTTAFNLVTGVYPLDRGSILLEGKELAGKEQFEITRSGIGRTFQNIRLFKGLSVLENVMTAADPYSQYGLFSLFTLGAAFRRREREVRAAAGEYLSLVGLEKYADEKPSNLPYGLQRKLEIARALATEPKVLLLDEPLASIDPETRDMLLTELASLRSRMTVIMVSHDISAIPGRATAVACVNRNVFYHDSGEILPGMFEKVWGTCPVELVAHGIPHRVLAVHTHDHSEDCAHD